MDEYSALSEKYIQYLDQSEKEYNQLIDKHNQLLDETDKVKKEYNKLVTEYNKLLRSEQSTLDSKNTFCDNLFRSSGGLNFVNSVDLDTLERDIKPFLENSQNLAPKEGIIAFLNILTTMNNLTVNLARAEEDTREYRHLCSPNEKNLSTTEELLTDIENRNIRLKKLKTKFQKIFDKHFN